MHLPGEKLNLLKKGGINTIKPRFIYLTFGIISLKKEWFVYMDLVTIGTAIGTSLLTNFAGKSECAPIKTLNDLWYLTFGKLELIVEQKKAKHAHSSITNLQRLGLVETSYVSSLTLDEYKIFKDHPYFIENKEKHGTIKILKSPGTIDSFHIQKGYVQLTPMGFLFLHICT